MNKIVLVSICVFFLCSCNSSNKEEKKRLVIYNEALLAFSPNYIGHFPFDLTHYNRRKLYVYHPGSTKYNLKAGLVLDTWVDSSYFKETYREIVYFIETKKGEFLENEELVKGLHLPKEWEHGLSRGIAVDTLEYRLVYWLVMW